MRQENTPILIINSMADDINVRFSPSAEEVKDAIEDSIMKGIAVVCNNELLISSPEFEIYISALEDSEDKQFEEEIDLLQMVINDSGFKDVDRQIKSAVDGSFDLLEEYTVYF